MFQKLHTSENKTRKKQTKQPTQIIVLFHQRKQTKDKGNIGKEKQITLTHNRKQQHTKQNALLRLAANSYKKKRRLIKTTSTKIIDYFINCYQTEQDKQPEIIRKKAKTHEHRKPNVNKQTHSPLTYTQNTKPYAVMKHNDMKEK